MPPLRLAARLLLGSLLVVAGLAHLTWAREEFRAQVPAWVPVAEDLVVVGSGVVELVLGAAFVALPRFRRVLGVLVAVLFVAVFPGNVAQYVEGVDAFGLDTDRARLLRLFLQPLLVLWALWAGELLPRRSSRRAPGEPSTRPRSAAG